MEAESKLKATRQLDPLARLVIPKDMREAAGFGANDWVDMTVTPSNEIIVKRASSSGSAWSVGTVQPIITTLSEVINAQVAFTDGEHIIATEGIRWAKVYTNTEVTISRELKDYIRSAEKKVKIIDFPAILVVPGMKLITECMASIKGRGAILICFTEVDEQPRIDAAAQTAIMTAAKILARQISADKG